MAVVLTKGQKVSLEKKPNASLGRIVVNLNWNSGKNSGGFFKKLFSSGSIDLDLGCLFELSDGRKGAIQALGNSFGNFDAPPYISLDGDDRTGSVTTGENMNINGGHIADIKRILVYTYIYEGVANWAAVDGIVTIKQSGCDDMIIKMDEHNNAFKMCALALIENENNETFTVEKLVRYFSGHKDMDAAFSWGLKWVAGSK